MASDLLSDFDTIQSYLSDRSDFGGAWLDKSKPAAIFVNYVGDAPGQIAFVGPPISARVTYKQVTYPLTALEELQRRLTGEILSRKYPAQYIAATSINIPENVVVLDVAFEAPTGAERVLRATYPFKYLRVGSRIRIDGAGSTSPIRRPS